MSWPAGRCATSACCRAVQRRACPARRGRPTKYNRRRTLQHGRGGGLRRRLAGLLEPAAKRARQALPAGQRHAAPEQSRSGRMHRSAGKACTYPVSELVSPEAAHSGRRRRRHEGDLRDRSGPPSRQPLPSSKPKKKKSAGDQSDPDRRRDQRRARRKRGTSRASTSSPPKALGGEAEAGQPNLYLSRRGRHRPSSRRSRVQMRRSRPLAGIPSPVNQEPVKHSARVSPDGRHLAFTSTAQPDRL